jgi:hypothetical protein
VRRHYGKTIVNENITKSTWKEEKMEAHVGIHGWKERNFVEL